ncbi:MAG: polysaccharide biosynthesis tyrosine autokinase [Pseudoflavonifractor sp.]|nr:polysaccharide biosynthesis tyrosine autokinase [Pseudoflavonifractor sp.]
MSSNPSQAGKPAGGINLLELYNEYKSKWWWFVVSVVVCCGLAFLYSLRKNPVFQVNANVLISQEDQSGSSSMMKMFSMGDMFGGYSSVDDEMMVMSSHSVLKQTVKDLQLNRSYYVRENLLQGAMKYLDAPVEIFYEPSINDTLSVVLAFRVCVDEDENVDVRVQAKKKTIVNVEDKKFPVSVETPYGLFVFNKTKYLEKGESFREYISLMNYDLAAENIGHAVDITIPNKKANMISLGIKGTLIGQSKAILNTIVENYNKVGIAEKQKKGQKTAEFISGRLESLSKELNATEQEVEDYKKSNNLTDVRAEASYLMGKRGEFERQLVTAETEFEILNMTREFISNPANRYALVPASGAIGSAADAINTYNGLVLERMKLENNAKANNAALKALSDQLDAMRGNIVTTIERAVENSLVKLRELRQKSNESLSRLGDIPRQEREYVNIKRQQEVKAQLFVYLLQQREETAISIANSMPRGMIVDEAFAIFEPVSMSRKRMLMMAFVLGLLIPVGLLYLKNKFKDKFESRAEFERYTSVPVLGEVCLTQRKGTLVVNGSSSVAELFRLIRSNLQFILNGRDDKVILVTSTVAGEGKSFVSVNLAGTLALLGKKVLLVGMDIRKPQLANYLNLPTEPGLTQYLSSDSYSLSDIVRVNPVMKNMDVIVAGPVPPNPAELLASHKVDDMFEQLKEKYDYIIVDSAPVGMVSDTFVLDRVSNATVYVCRANYTSIKDIQYLNAIYADKRLRKMAVIVNGTPTRKGYGYGYGKAHDSDEDGK